MLNEFRPIAPEIPEQMAEILPMERAVGIADASRRLYGVVLCVCEFCTQHVRPHWRDFNVFLAGVLTDPATVHALIAQGIAQFTPSLTGWPFRHTQSVAPGELTYNGVDRFEVCFNRQPVMTVTEPDSTAVTTDAPEGAAPVFFMQAPASGASASRGGSEAWKPVSTYHGVAVMLTCASGQLEVSGDRRLTEAVALERVAGSIHVSPRITSESLAAALERDPPATGLHISLGSYPGGCLPLAFCRATHAIASNFVLSTLRCDAAARIVEGIGWQGRVSWRPFAPACPDNNTGRPLP
jgi:hypothetical protein